MKKPPLNFAVVGCGMIAQSIHLPNIVRSERAILHTCCDLNQQSLQLCREQYSPLHLSTDFQETIANPEVDVICLMAQETLRLPVIEAAAKAGKPIYVEKPIANSLEEAFAIQKVVKDSGIPFCIGHNRRCSPAMMDAHRIFRQHMESPRPNNWRFDREGARRPENLQDRVAGMSVRINDDWHGWKLWAMQEDKAPHGPMLFEMTHFTDLCNWFLAAEPEAVVALGSGNLNHGIVVRYKTGEIATLTMCANGSTGYPKELYEVMGGGAVVVIDQMLEVRVSGIDGEASKITYPILNDIPDENDDGFDGWYSKKQKLCQKVAEANDTSLFFEPESGMQMLDSDRGHSHALERFIDQICGDGPVVCGVNDAITATAVAFAAIKSVQESRVVKVAEIVDM